MIHSDFPEFFLEFIDAFFERWNTHISRFVACSVQPKELSYRIELFGKISKNKAIENKNNRKKENKKWNKKHKNKNWKIK